jgi:hypothetical protein
MRGGRQQNLVVDDGHTTERVTLGALQIVRVNVTAERSDKDNSARVVERNRTDRRLVLYGIEANVLIHVPERQLQRRGGVR